MPASTNASYVGRFAPPGSPNTTSTPSALRHSIRASTARIVADSSRGSAGRKKTEVSGEVLGRSGVLELGAAARAQRVVYRNDAAAGGAAAMRLVVLVSVRGGGDEPEERDARRDQEPDEERRALELADDPARQAEREGDDQVGQAFHGTVSSAAWRPPR